jgi:hypothetical protein
MNISFIVIYDMDIEFENSEIMKIEKTTIFKKEIIKEK